MIALRNNVAVVLFLLASLAGSVLVASPASANHDLHHHWSANGLAVNQVYFIDHTSAKYPVNQVVYEWNKAVGVNSYYIWKDCPNFSVHCVHVYEQTIPETWYGVTKFPSGWDAWGHNYGGVHVILNNNMIKEAAQARKTTCHELGHALGLDHTRTENSTCMKSGFAGTVISQYPDFHDYDLLRAVYDGHAN